MVIHHGRTFPIQNVEMFRKKIFFLKTIIIEKIIQIERREIGNAMLYYSKYRLMIFVRLLNEEEFSQNIRVEELGERLEDDVDSFTCTR